MKAYIGGSRLLPFMLMAEMATMTGMPDQMGPGIKDFKMSNPRFRPQKKVDGHRHWPRNGPKIGRNETCPCGSGKKNKHCCKK